MSHKTFITRQDNYGNTIHKPVDYHYDNGQNPTHQITTVELEQKDIVIMQALLFKHYNDIRNGIEIWKTRTPRSIQTYLRDILDNRKIVLCQIRFDNDIIPACTFNYRIEK
jgi:hypothetical protein